MEIVGACFILFIGYKILTSNKFEIEENQQIKYLKFHEGFLLQWLNPKAWLACISGVSMFGNSSFDLYVFVILYFVVCYVCLSFWGVVGNKLTSFFNSQFKLKIFNIVMGMLLILIASYVLGLKIFS